jgi:hypothetical protein
VYFDHSSRPRDRHKDLDRTPPEFFPAAVTPSRRSNPLIPAQRAHRDAAPRGALAGAAPTSGAARHPGAGEGRP